MALELKRLKRTKIVQNMLENTSSLRGFLSVEPTTEQKQAYLNFFISVADVLPCKYCRAFKNNLYVFKRKSTFLKIHHGT